MNFRKLAAIWCLAGMLCGEVAQANVIIFYTEDFAPGYAGTANSVKQNMQRDLRLVSSIVGATGGTYRAVPTDAGRSEWYRCAYMVWNMGATTPAAPSAGAYREQFDASIVLDPATNSASVPFRPDSTMLSAFQGGSAKTDRARPALLLRTNVMPLLPIAFLADSLANTYDGGPGKAAFLPGDRISFLTHAYTVGALNLGVAANSGHQRRVLFGGVPQVDYRTSNGTNSTATVGCRNCDSLMSVAANDTCLIWDKFFGNKYPAQGATVVLASAWGAGAFTDSLSNDNLPPTEGDLTIILAALAHLDSLVRASSTTGGKVLGDKVIRIAPVVYGGLTRGPRHSWDWTKSQGINDADTSSFYAILDSLASRPDIKVTFAVDPDSGAAYLRDVIKLKSVSQARFTPQVWGGINDTTLTAYASYPKDVFGRYTYRIAVGDSVRHSIVTGDSSVCALLARAKAMTDSIFSRDRASTVVAAPSDDWSPLNLVGITPGLGLLARPRIPIDSVLYAMKLAGFTGVIADAQDPDATGKRIGGPAQSNPRGFYNRQSVYSSAMIPDLRNFKILCHSGFNLMGGRAQVEAFDGAGAVDSSAAPSATSNLIYQNLYRLWASALLEYDESYDSFPYDNVNAGAYYFGTHNIFHRKLDFTEAQKKRPIKHGNIVRLSCADLSGASGTSVVPAATMWHVLKAAANAMYVINKLAGRTVVTFAYPEDIDP